jgi:hypothetical protein
MKNKNVFVIPTTEPSQIYLIKDKDALGLTSKNPEAMEHNGLGTHNQHVYITKKEPYDRGDWCIDIEAEEIFKVAEVKEYSGIVRSDTETYVYDACVKIVLTSDMKLITDGIKEINNDFLMTLCENHFNFYNIEAEKVPMLSNNGRALYGYSYNPIIRKKESKYPIGGFATGNYMCNCTTCKKQFMGDKRAVQCEPCAIEMINTTRTVNDEGGFEIDKQETTLEEYFLSNISTLEFEIKALKSIIIDMDATIKSLFNDDEVLNLCGHFSVEIQRQNKRGQFPIQIKEWFERNKEKFKNK